MAGCIATYGACAATRVTYSTSVVSSISSRERVPWPSWRVTWSSRTSILGEDAGRWSSPSAASSSIGATSTTRTGSPNSTASPTPIAPTSRARPSAAVGCQEFICDLGVSRVVGVGTSPRTASTTARPLASVIQSSGRTVIRCDSTDRATTLTSSGMT